MVSVFRFSSAFRYGDQFPFSFVKTTRVMTAGWVNSREKLVVNGRVASCPIMQCTAPARRNLSRY